MPTFDDDRYNELVSSAFESAYTDEMEKMAIWGTLARGIPWLARAGAKAAPKAVGAATKPGILSRFGTRTSHALGLGKRLKPGATPAEIAAHEQHLATAGIRGAKPMTQAEIAAKAGEKAKTGLGSRIKRFIQGKKFDEAAEAKRIGQAMTKQEGAARKMYELGATSLPGAARAAVRHPGQLMGAGWKSMPKWQKYMMGGMGAMQAKEVAEMQGKTPEEKAEILARSAALAPLWLGTAGVGGMLVPMAGWIGGEEAAVAGAKALARKTHPEQYPQKHELSLEDIQGIREQARLEAMNQ